MHQRGYIKELEELKRELEQHMATVRKLVSPSVAIHSFSLCIHADDECLRRRTASARISSDESAILRLA